jgi:hypothetical protein
MVRMLAPDGITQVSVEQQNFKVAKDGFVTVPEPFIARLKDIGFKLGPFVATVSEATAQAIKNTAAPTAADPASDPGNQPPARAVPGEK